MLSKYDRSKLGNTIVYMAERVPDLRKTKLLKLLYLMEETMVRLYCVPFLAMPYEVWRLGPVQKDVFVDISDGARGVLSEHIRIENEYIHPLHPFDDGEFSDVDIEIMDSILQKYGKWSAKELVDLVHDKHGLWYKTAQRHGLLRIFEDKVESCSDVRIDLSELLDDCDKEFYKETLELQLAARQQRLAAYV